MQHKRLLQEQVELLQTKIVDLSNENMELTSSLQTAAYKTAAKDEELTILKRHSEHDTARLVDVSVPCCMVPRGLVDTPARPQH